MQVWLMGCNMMKTLIVTTIAAACLGAMGMAQAGVPTSHPAKTHAAKAESAHAAPMPTASTNQNPPATAAVQNTTQPTIPGAHKAQSHALTNGEQMAIVGGVILAAGIIFSVTDNGNHHSTSGTSGTTGTH